MHTFIIHNLKLPVLLLTRYNKKQNWRQWSNSHIRPICWEKYFCYSILCFLRNVKLFGFLFHFSHYFFFAAVKCRWGYFAKKKYDKIFPLRKSTCYRRYSFSSFYFYIQLLLLCNFHVPYRITPTVLAAVNWHSQWKYPVNPLQFFFRFIRENKNGLVGQKWYASNYHKKTIYNEVDISEEITVWVCVLERMNFMWWPSV